MYLAILILPFLSFFSTNLFGRFIGTFGCCVLSTMSIFTSFLLAIFIFFEVVLSSSSCLVTICPWFQTELLVVSWGFLFDTLSSIMFLVVLSVSSLVHIYSTEYLASDPHQGRFMGYLSLFTGFMLVLVSADNFVVMFFGWEGIGLASFLLIGFWFTRIQASKSAIKAMLVNRVGDLGLVLAISAIFVTFKSVDYMVVFALTPNVINNSFSLFSFEFDRLTVIAFFLFWGAVGKSAQIGLHIWLPDAMEGPTPVSALIHAATLVTAGVFLVIRCSVIFDNCHILFLVTFLGALTAFFASSVGLVQYDLKRVIAYSTCSQLGYMMFAAGLSHYSIALFHLANHALFKALLFLSAGCLIHGVSDEQDLRKMGGLVRFFPTSYTMILIGSLALTGFPFLTGFYSKDAILEIAISKHTFWGNLAHFLGCSAALCTSFYSFRLLFLAFINDTNSYKKYFDHVHEAPLLMIFPLLLLSLGAIFWGFLSKDLFIGMGNATFANTIFTANFNYNAIDAEFLASSLKNIPLFCTITGFIFSVLLVNCLGVSKLNVFNSKVSSVTKSGFIFLSQKWNFDQITNELIVVKAMNFGYRNTFQLIDKGNIESFGATSIGAYLYGLSKAFANYQNGRVAVYTLLFIVSVFVLFWFFTSILSGGSFFLSAYSVVIFCYLIYYSTV